jgi:hypothetical protein
VAKVNSGRRRETASQTVVVISPHYSKDKLYSLQHFEKRGKGTWGYAMEAIKKEQCHINRRTLFVTDCSN